MKTAVRRGIRFAAILVFAATAVLALRADDNAPAKEAAPDAADAAEAAEAPKSGREAALEAAAGSEEKKAPAESSKPAELPPLPDAAKPAAPAPPPDAAKAGDPAPALPEMPEPKSDAPAAENAAAPEGETAPPAGREARIRSLGAVVAAMVSEDDALKIDHLLRAVEAEPFGADAALIHLVTICSLRRNAEAALQRFDALWKRYPTSLPIARSGCALHRAAGENALGAALLDRSLAELAPLRGDDDGDLFALRLERIEFFSRMQQFAEAAKYINGLLPRVGERRGRLLETALETYATGALRTEGGHKPAADWINSAYPCRRAHAETLLALRRIDGEVVSRTVCDKRIALYQRHGRHDFALALAEDFARRFPGKRSQLRVVSAAAEAGNFKKCEAMLFIMSPDLGQTLVASLRFHARLKAKDFEAAAAYLDTPEAEPIRIRARLTLLAEERNWQELLKESLAFARRGREEAAAVSMQLLIAAERGRSREALDLVRKTLGPEGIAEPVYANAIGYVSAIIGGGDLEEDSRLVESALERDPENAAYLDSLACIRLRQNKLDEAEKLIRHALRRVTLDTGIAVLIEHAADIAAARGSRAEALAGYRGALALAAEDTEVDVEELKRKIAALEGKKSE